MEASEMVEAKAVEVPTKEEVAKRDSGVIVLLYEANNSLYFKEFDTKREVSSFIQQVGGPSKVKKLYVGAKERAVETNVSYSF